MRKSEEIKYSVIKGEGGRSRGSTHYVFKRGTHTWHHNICMTSGKACLGESRQTMLTRQFLASTPHV